MPWVSDQKKAEQAIWHWIEAHWNLTDAEERELSDLLDDLANAANQAGSDGSRI